MEHAILMICHNNVSVVQRAMKMLDDKRFHFYIMIDSKSDISPSSLKEYAEESSCDFVDGISIFWGGYSYTKAVISLINEALNNPQIQYFHMLQGADLPLKTPKEIDNFFVKNYPTNYMEFWKDNFPKMAYRMGCKHFFVENKYYRKRKFIHYLDSAIAKLQIPFHRNDVFYLHHALFSISRDFAEYLVKDESILKEKYKYTVLAEESLFGTLIINSPYKKTLDKETRTRLIDWKRKEGTSPHTYRSEDFDLLLEYCDVESCIFARKFSETIDTDIINKIFNYIIMKKKHQNN